uniref:Uncharacterized protein n=1 Tax=Ananas comosus var. bracteatus TaxID=296719 RepID=A0A6V7QT36_ANACO
MEVALRKFQDILSNMRNEEVKFFLSLSAEQSIEIWRIPFSQPSRIHLTKLLIEMQLNKQFSALQSPKSPSSNVATVDCLQTNKDENMITSESSIPEAES